MYYQLYALRSKLSRYNSFKGQIEGLVDKLSPAISDLDETIKSIEKDFKYNDNSADNGDVKKYRDDISGIIEYLNNSILPEIGSKIIALQNEIEEVELAIELEKQQKNS